MKVRNGKHLYIFFFWKLHKCKVLHYQCISVLLYKLIKTISRGTFLILVAIKKINFKCSDLSATFGNISQYEHIIYLFIVLPDWRSCNEFNLI